MHDGRYGRDSRQFVPDSNSATSALLSTGESNSRNSSPEMRDSAAAALRTLPADDPKYAKVVTEMKALVKKNWPKRVQGGSAPDR